MAGRSGFKIISEIFRSNGQTRKLCTTAVSGGTQQNAARRAILSSSDNAGAGRSSRPKSSESYFLGERRTRCVSLSPAIRDRCNNGFSMSMARHRHVEEQASVTDYQRHQHYDESAPSTSGHEEHHRHHRHHHKTVAESAQDTAAAAEESRHAPTRAAPQRWWSEVRAFKEEKPTIRMPEYSIAPMIIPREPAPRPDKVVTRSQLAAEHQLRVMKTRLHEQHTKQMRYAAMSGADWVDYLVKQREYNRKAEEERMISELEARMEDNDAVSVTESCPNFAEGNHTIYTDGSSLPIPASDSMANAVSCNTKNEPANPSGTAANGNRGGIMDAMSRVLTRLLGVGSQPSGNKALFCTICEDGCCAKMPFKCPEVKPPKPKPKRRKTGGCTKLKFSCPCPEPQSSKAKDSCEESGRRNFSMSARDESLDAPRYYQPKELQQQQFRSRVVPLVTSNMTEEDQGLITHMRESARSEYHQMRMGRKQPLPFNERPHSEVFTINTQREAANLPAREGKYISSDVAPESEYEQDLAEHSNVEADLADHSTEQIGEFFGTAERAKWVPVRSSTTASASQEGSSSNAVSAAPKSGGGKLSGSGHGSGSGKKKGSGKHSKEPRLRVAISTRLIPHPPTKPESIKMPKPKLGVSRIDMSLRLFPKKGRAGGVFPRAACAVKKPKSGGGGGGGKGKGKGHSICAPPAGKSPVGSGTGQSGSPMAGKPAPPIVAKSASTPNMAAATTATLQGAGVVPAGEVSLELEDLPKPAADQKQAQSEMDVRVAGYVRKNLSQPKFATDLKAKIEDVYRMTQDGDANKRPSLSALQAKLIETIHKLSNNSNGVKKTPRTTQKAMKAARRSQKRIVSPKRLAKKKSVGRGFEGVTEADQRRDYDNFWAESDTQQSALASNRQIMPKCHSTVVADKSNKVRDEVVKDISKTGATENDEMLLPPVVTLTDSMLHASMHNKLLIGSVPEMSNMSVQKMTKKYITKRPARNTRRLEALETVPLSMQQPESEDNSVIKFRSVLDSANASRGRGRIRYSRKTDTAMHRGAFTGNFKVSAKDGGYCAIIPPFSMAGRGNSPHASADQRNRHSDAQDKLVIDSKVEPTSGSSAAENASVASKQDAAIQEEAPPYVVTVTVRVAPIEEEVKAVKDAQKTAGDAMTAAESATLPLRAAALEAAAAEADSELRAEESHTEETKDDQTLEKIIEDTKVAYLEETKAESKNAASIKESVKMNQVFETSETDHMTEMQRDQEIVNRLTAEDSARMGLAQTEAEVLEALDRDKAEAAAVLNASEAVASVTEEEANFMQKMFGKSANKGDGQEDEMTHITALLNVIAEKRKEAVKKMNEQVMVDAMQNQVQQTTVGSSTSKNKEDEKKAEVCRKSLQVNTITGETCIKSGMVDELPQLTTSKSSDSKPKKTDNLERMALESNVINAVLERSAAPAKEASKTTTISEMFEETKTSVLPDNAFDTEKAQKTQNDVTKSATQPEIKAEGDATNAPQNIEVHVEMSKAENVSEMEAVSSGASSATQAKPAASGNEKLSQISSSTMQDAGNSGAMHNIYTFKIRVPKSVNARDKITLMDEGIPKPMITIVGPIEAPITESNSVTESAKLPSNTSAITLEPEAAELVQQMAAEGFTSPNAKTISGGPAMSFSSQGGGKKKKSKRAKSCCKKMPFTCDTKPKSKDRCVPCSQTKQSEDINVKIIKSCPQQKCKKLVKKKSTTKCPDKQRCFSTTKITASPPKDTKGAKPPAKKMKCEPCPGSKDSKDKGGKHPSGKKSAGNIPDPPKSPKSPPAGKAKPKCRARESKSATKASSEKKRVPVCRRSKSTGAAASGSKGKKPVPKFAPGKEPPKCPKGSGTKIETPKCPGKPVCHTGPPLEKKVPKCLKKAKSGGSSGGSGKCKPAPCRRTGSGTKIPVPQCGTEPMGSKAFSTTTSTTSSARFAECFSKVPPALAPPPCGCGVPPCVPCPQLPKCSDHSSCHSFINCPETSKTCLDIAIPAPPECPVSYVPPSVCKLIVQNQLAGIARREPLETRVPFHVLCEPLRPPPPECLKPSMQIPRFPPVPLADCASVPIIEQDVKCKGEFERPKPSPHHFPTRVYGNENLGPAWFDGTTMCPHYPPDCDLPGRTKLVVVSRMPEVHSVIPQDPCCAAKDIPIKPCEPMHQSPTFPPCGQVITKSGFEAPEVMPCAGKCPTPNMPACGKGSVCPKDPPKLCQKSCPEKISICKTPALPKPQLNPCDCVLESTCGKPVPCKVLLNAPESMPIDFSPKQSPESWQECCAECTTSKPKRKCEEVKFERPEKLQCLAPIERQRACNDLAGCTPQAVPQGKRIPRQEELDALKAKAIEERERAREEREDALNAHTEEIMLKKLREARRRSEWK